MRIIIRYYFCLIFVHFKLHKVILNFSYWFHPFISMVVSKSIKLLIYVPIGYNALYLIVHYYK